MKRILFETKSVAKSKETSHFHIESHYDLKTLADRLPSGTVTSIPPPGGMSVIVSKRNCTRFSSLEP